VAGETIVISNLKPYPAYKESAIPWLGDMPEHWEIRRGKNLFKCIDMRSSTGEEELLTVSSEHGIVPRRSTAVTMFKAESYIGYKLCWPKDLVINSLWAWARGLGVSKYHGIVSSAYGVYRLLPKFEDYHGYIHELVRSNPFQWELQVRSKGIWISRLQLTDEAFLDAPFPMPPHDEIAVIVRFLDHMDRHIRCYIRAKQKLIRLLEGYKQVIIHRAVTRGLDPSVQLKSSGVEWLGNVPKHWEIRQVKQVSRILRGKFTHRPRNDPALYDGPYPFIQTGEVARANKTIAHYRQTLNERGLAISKMFPAGTLVMTIAANIGDVAVLDFEACFPDSIVGFVPFDGVERDYLYYVFQSMKPELLCEAPINTQGNLNIDRIGSRKIALPSTTEQILINQQIEKSVIDLNTIIAHTRYEIDLLREYRARLISDVVTGKLDVRGMGLPATADAEVPEEYSDLLDSEAVMEDEELQEEIPAESD